MKVYCCVTDVQVCVLELAGSSGTSRAAGDRGVLSSRCGLRTQYAAAAAVRGSA